MQSYQNNLSLTRGEITHITIYSGLKPLIAVRSNKNQLQIEKINKDETMQKHLIKEETKINPEN